MCGQLVFQVSYRKVVLVFTSLLAEETIREGRNRKEVKKENSESCVGDDVQNLC